jgi:AmiR/NasT family two-component response regulator
MAVAVQEERMVTPQRRKIVIVEDEGLVAADLKARLETEGYLVPGIADSAQRAIALIEQTAPDLVLMDIRLKGQGDGVQAAAVVREMLDIPVIYLTAYSDQETIERVGPTQAFGFITKPIATASLKGAIEVALSKHRYERALSEDGDRAKARLVSLPYAVLVTDLQGRVTHMNLKAEELAGWTLDQALNHPIGEVLRMFSRETGKPVEDLVPLAMVRRETIPLPDGICLIGSQERTFTIKGNAAPLLRAGCLEGVVLVLTDVTLDQFVDEQLRQKAKQDALVRMAEGVVRQLPDLSEMAYQSTRLLKALPEDSPLRESAERVERAAMDAFETTRHLRAFADSPDFHLERVTLYEMTVRFGDLFRAIAPGLIVSVEPEPMPVQIDQWGLVTALVNVLLHARSRMKPDTSLVMEISCADAEQMGPFIRIRITYATACEDAALLERVFEPSWSGPSEDLHITHSLVKRMGGLASARLENGDLVRFDIFLQLVP